MPPRRNLLGSLERWASRSVAKAIPGSACTAAIGDLSEEYFMRARLSSRARAARWYWAQMARSILPLWWAEARREGWVGTLGVAAGAYIVATAVESAADFVMANLLSSEAVATSAPGLVVGLAAMALGGYLAGSIRPASATLLPCLIFVIVVILMITSSQYVPMWYQIGFLVGGPVVSMAGGTCRRTAL